jgi:cell division inhibitor SulA
MKMLFALVLLQALDRLYGSKPGLPIKPVVIVTDNSPIHISKVTLAALAERAHWLIVEWLPKYAPRGRCSLKFRAKTSSVGQPTNLGLAAPMKRSSGPNASRRIRWWSAAWL